MSSKRAAVIELYKQGQGVNNIARLLKMHKQSVSRMVSRFKELGTLEDRPRSGRPPDVRIQKAKKVIKAKIRRNPKRSMRQLAKEGEISDRTVRRLVNDELRKQSLKLQETTALTEEHIIFVAPPQSQAPPQTQAPPKNKAPPKNRLNRRCRRHLYTASYTNISEISGISKQMEKYKSKSVNRTYAPPDTSIWINKELTVALSVPTRGLRPLERSFPAFQWLCQCQLAAFGRSKGVFLLFSGFVSANSRPSAARKEFSCFSVALSVICVSD
ncbi:winged helix-turn helix domain-containing protein [Ditylenchus destructor]|nr:winged helix-turn helix domain-containing protein [Ditylenchus destructor]